MRRAVNKATAWATVWESRSLPAVIQTKGPIDIGPFVCTAATVIHTVARARPSAAQPPGEERMRRAVNKATAWATGVGEQVAAGSNTNKRPDMHRAFLFVRQRPSSTQFPMRAHRRRSRPRLARSASCKKSHCMGNRCSDVFETGTCAGCSGKTRTRMASTRASVSPSSDRRSRSPVPPGCRRRPSRRSRAGSPSPRQAWP